MLSINTNLSSLIAQRAMQTSTDRLNQAVERMSTGFKINHAKDNAANYSISTNLTTKINAYQIAEDNVAMGMDMLTTADENLSLISDKLIRLRDLATQASNGTYGTNSLNAINAEANALVDEINRLYTTAEYNGMKLFESNETSAVSPANARAVGADNFIKDITWRDTTGMTPLASVDTDQILASDTYSISTVEELKKLAYLANTGKMFDLENGVAYGTYEFVLANDIDLSSVENWTPIGGQLVEDLNGDGVMDTFDIGAFTGTFDGNGFVIRNMTIKDMPFDIDTDDGVYVGLFGAASNSVIKNLGVEDAKIINSGEFTGILIGGSVQNSIENCYTTGIVEGKYITSGICGYVMGGTIDSSYSTATVSSNGTYGGNKAAFGLSYYCTTDDGAGNYIPGLTNSFFAGKIVGEYNFANNVAFPLDILDDCVGANCNYIDTWASEDNKQKFEQAAAANGRVLDPPMTLSELKAHYGVDLNFTKSSSPAPEISLQVGINSDHTSAINVQIGFALAGVEDLRGIGQDTTIDFLTQLDDMLATVNEKQVEYGSAQNRLESALDEISTQYENLVSSRSTLRDADIAEVSAEYIQQQILQQAAATLMSTANQSPAIALQLI